jgi:transposase, IS6 family
VDETYVKAAGQWRHVYRAIDQFGQVIDVFMSRQRDARAARWFFERAIATTRVTPTEVVTDRAATYPIVVEDLLPASWHRTQQYANNHVQADHGRLKARLRPMRGLKQDCSARVIIAGHAFVQNVRRGRYELAVEVPGTDGWRPRSTTSPWRSDPNWWARLEHAVDCPDATAPMEARDGDGAPGRCPVGRL